VGAKKKGQVRVLGGGVGAVADLLNHLNPEENKKLFSEMEKMDPELTLKIKQNLVTLEDICFLSTDMIRVLLQSISLKDWGLALRMVSAEVKNHLLASVSQNMKQEILEILEGPPQKKSNVLEAQMKILEIMREKLEKGEIVILRGGKDEYI